MRIFMILAVVCALTEALPAKRRAPPTHHNLFSRLLHNKRSEQECGAALSDAAGEVLDQVEKSGYLGEGQIAPMLQDNPGLIKALMAKSAGFDIFDDDARKERACILTRVQDLDGLKDAMRDEIHGTVGLAYAYAITMYPIMAATSPEYEPIIQVLESLGLDKLDPAGVAWFQDLTGLKNFLPPYTPQETDASPVEAKCAVVQGMAHAMLEQVMQEPFVAMFVNMWVTEWTGIDLTNTEQVDKLLCNIMRAAPKGLDSVIDAIDDMGVIDSFLRRGYQEFLLGFQDLKANLEMMVAMLDNMPGGIPPNNPHADSVPDYYNYYGGPPHQPGPNDLPPGYPAYGNGYPPPGPMAPSTEILALMRAALELLREVEKTNLLSLE